MLVLNTNTNDQVDWISNRNLRNGTYPDATQALIYPHAQSWGTIYMYPNAETQTTSVYRYCEWVNNVITPSIKSSKAVLVNGTPINYIDETIIVDHSLYWGYAANNVWPEHYICFNSYPTVAGFDVDRTGCENVWEIHKTIRFWTFWELDSWITVWKRFLFSPSTWQRPGVYVNTSVATFNCIEWGIMMKWWLLHTDWTIDYAWCLCKYYRGTPTGSWSYYPEWMSSGITNPVFYWESEWLISQQWDRPIVDFDNYMCWDMNYVTTWNAAHMNSYSTVNCCAVSYMTLWRRWGWAADDNGYSRPFQISLDV